MTHVELRSGRRVPVVEPELTISGAPLMVAPVPAELQPTAGWSSLVQCTWCGQRCYVTFAQLGAIPEGSAAAPVCMPCAIPFLEVRLTPTAPCSCLSCRQRRAGV